MVVLLVERFIFPVQYSNMSNRPLWGADVYPWISNSNLSKQGMTDLEEYRCLLYLAVSVSWDETETAEEMMVWRCCVHFNNSSALFVALYPIHLICLVFFPFELVHGFVKTGNWLGRKPNLSLLYLCAWKHVCA